MAEVMVARDFLTGIDNTEVLPTTFDVAQNYPNPFNPTTTISYQIPQVSDVKLVIYNVLGQKVRTLVNDRLEAGYHSVVWDGRNELGQTVSSGVYIYRFEASDFTKTLKLMLLK
jgi:flagellar hook assembly protein FlgD